MALENALYPMLRLLEKLSLLFYWFTSNDMKANTEKCHQSASCDNETSICVSNYNITKSNSEELLKRL